MTVGAVVPAAGRGTRFGSSRSKLFVTIAGQSVLRRSVRALAEHEMVTDVVVAASRHDLGDVARELAGLPKIADIVEGGATRCESVLAGLRALPARADTVLVHDAARPALSRAVIEAVVAGVARWGAAVPGVAVSDTVKRTSPSGLVEETVPRDGLWLVQTPQGARRELLESAYGMLSGMADPPTDEAGILERSGHTVGIVQGDPNNIKLTTAADLVRLESVIRAGDGTAAPEEAGSQSTSPTDAGQTEPMPRRERDDRPPFRTGIGYDVHRLEAGVPLWLGGVRISHSHGLIGHSDADVVLHAVCDALLGAVGAEDIGTLFPNTDERNKGRASREFVEAAASVVRAAGYEIGSIDIAIQAERPRIGPYRDAMRREIAAAAAVSADRIGIKATTNERLGYVGRGEGIGCWAVASVYQASRFLS